MHVIVLIVVRGANTIVAASRKCKLIILCAFKKRAHRERARRELYYAQRLVRGFIVPPYPETEGVLLIGADGCSLI